MQACVAFLSVLLIAFASGADDNKKAAVLQQCKTQLKIDDDVANIGHLKKEATTEQEKCFLQCFYENMGLIKNGELSREGSDALSRHRYGDKPELLQKAQEIFEKCKSSYKPSEEKCALGKHIRSCIIQNDNEQLNFFGKQ